MRKKIVFTSYIGSRGYTEPGRWLKRISAYTGVPEELAKKHEIISIEQINFEGTLERNGVKYQFLNFKKDKLYFPWKLHRYIKKIKPDVVIVHGLIFPIQIIQLRLTLGRKVKLIVQNHAEKPFEGFRKRLQKLADLVIHHYLFTSYEMGMEWVRQGIIADEKKIVEVMEASSGFHVTSKQTALTKTKVQGSPVFLWVGRLDANKDPLTVVRAFLNFLQHDPQAKLYMIYHTAELLPEIKTLIGAEHNSIHLVGQIPYEEMEDWYNAADFIVSTSHYEGSGVAVCEAMSCGCIPLVTDILSFRKMTGGCGILFPPGDDKALLKALIQTKYTDIASEKVRVLKQFQKELSFEAIAQKINEIIG